MRTEAEVIASALAHADDALQAAVLNEFVDLLTVLCKAGGRAAGDQGFYIAKLLRGQTVAFLKELVSTYEYLETRNAQVYDQLYTVEQRLAQREAELKRLDETV